MKYSLLLFVLLSLSVSFCKGQEQGNGIETTLAGSQIFETPLKVVQLHVSVSEAEFKAMTPKIPSMFGNFGPPKPPTEGAHRNTFGAEFPWAKANLTFGEETLSDVGLRYKGNYTFMATGQSLKKSFKIDFNKNVEGQKLDGLSKINLHCGVSDPSMSREAISLAFFRDVGVPVPRCVFAELFLSVPGKYDNEYVGVYTLVEQVNKGFLAQHFGDGNGLLMKPEGLQGGLSHLGPGWKVYEDRYRPDGVPSDKQKQRLIEFTNLISNASAEDFAKDVESYLDMEAFLKFIAANTLLSNLDSYLGFGHNFYLYLVPSSNKFVFIPWDLDLSLATWPAVGTPEQLVKLSIDHPHAGDNKLLDRLFAIPRHKERYLALVQEMLESQFSNGRELEKVSQFEEILKAPLEKEKKAVSARKEGAAKGGFGMGFGGGQFGQSMPPRLFAKERAESVAEQLAGKDNGFVPKPFGFGFGGFGPPSK